jgi:hypothetical protein
MNFKREGQKSDVYQKKPLTFDNHIRDLKTNPTSESFVERANIADRNFSQVNALVAFS